MSNHLSYLLFLHQVYQILHQFLPFFQWFLTIPPALPKAVTRQVFEDKEWNWDGQRLFGHGSIRDQMRVISKHAGHVCRIFATYYCDVNLSLNIQDSTWRYPPTQFSPSLIGCWLPLIYTCGTNNMTGLPCRQSIVWYLLSQIYRLAGRRSRRGLPQVCAVFLWVEQGLAYKEKR